MAGSTSSPSHRPDTLVAHKVAVEKVISHMKANLEAWDVDFSLDAFARAACYSKGHLIEVFEEITGTTPHHFLASLRIQKAKDLLLNSRASVTEIALQVGYQSFPTFSRTFSDYVGVSPSGFRMQPQILTPPAVAAAMNTFLGNNRPRPKEPVIEGQVLTSSKISGVVFVGTFTHGVPQGKPHSGTILMGPGRYQIVRPTNIRFHLLAALVKAPDIGFTVSCSLSPILVASCRIGDADVRTIDLNLRPMSSCDPPLLVSLPALLS